MIKHAQKDDAFQWPPVDVANLEAMDLDRNVIVSLPVVAESATERDEQTARDGPQRDERAAREDSVRRMWTSRRNRWIDTARTWAVPVLAALVLIESSWLVRQNVRDRSRVAAAPAPANRSITAAPVAVPQVPTAVQGGEPTQAPTSDVRQPTVPPRLLASPSRDSGASSNVKAAPQPRDIPRASEPGWISVPLPIQVQVFENGRFVGTNDSNQIGFAAGRHELELVNEPLQFRTRTSIDVQSGKGTTVNVSLATGRLQLNATPWADVFVDGKNVGLTPVGNVEATIGPHQIVFRHPQFGEQSRSVVVSAGTSTPVAVDFKP